MISEGKKLGDTRSWKFYELDDPSEAFILVCLIYSKNRLLSTATSIGICSDLPPCCSCGITPELHPILVNLLPE